MEIDKGMFMTAIVLVIMVVIIKMVFYGKKPASVEPKPPVKVKNPKIDCKVSKWKDWSKCKDGYQERKREVIIDPFNGGMTCPVLTEMKSCSIILQIKITRDQGDEKIALNYVNENNDVKELKATEFIGEQLSVDTSFEIKDSIKRIIVKQESGAGFIEVNQVTLNGNVIYNENTKLVAGKELILKL